MARSHATRPRIGPSFVDWHVSGARGLDSGGQTPRTTAGGDKGGQALEVRPAEPGGAERAQPCSGATDRSDPRTIAAMAGSIERVFGAGAGLMGHGIAQVHAAVGLAVVLFEP